MKNWDSYEYLDREYNQKKRSTSEIAAEHGVFPNTIRRALKRYGFPIRNRSDAQHINIERNGAPMAGKIRSKEEKERISNGLQKFWSTLEDGEAEAKRQNLAEVGRERWGLLDEEEKQQCIAKMHNASRLKVGEGSKNENLVAHLLEKSGYSIVQRSNEYSPNRQFEIDIVIPQKKVAIEWDGATHFEPIYGEEHLEKVQNKDERKNRQLIALGWKMIRCRDHSTAHSLAFCKRAVSLIIDILNGPLDKKLYIIEAK